MMKIAERLAALDWEAIERSLWQSGYARTPPVLTADECAALIAMYGERERFRSRVEMARFRFGVGDYQYFAAPLPPIVEDLRVHAYPPLAAVANRWEEALGSATRHPETLAALASRVSRGTGRRSRRRCSSTTRPAATTACTRTSTVTSCSRSSSRAS